MDGMLSQEEINALLNGMSAGDSDNTDTAATSDDNTPATAETVSSAVERLTPEEEDALGEISNISMGTAATTLSSLLNQRVDITTPTVTYASWEELSAHYDRPCVLMRISYKEGLDGNNILVLKESDVKIITDLMLGGSGTVSDEPLTELHLSAIGEAMNQMMGSAATSMSSMLNKKIDISPPVANIVDFNEEDESELENSFASEFVKIAFKMNIGTLIDSEIMQLYPISFAKSLYQMFKDNMEALANTEVNVSHEETPAPQPAEQPQPVPQQAAPQPAAPQPQPQPVPQPAAPQPMQQPVMGDPQAYGYVQAPYMGQPMYAPQPNVNVQPTTFQPFDPAVTSLVQRENINLIKDVPLEVTVELGRTKKSISDILEFAPGTIVELDKLAGEPVDVFVNGKHVAKGEVVVIEESFGVRITEVVK